MRHAYFVFPNLMEHKKTKKLEKNNPIGAYAVLHASLCVFMDFDQIDRDSAPLSVIMKEVTGMFGRLETKIIEDILADAIRLGIFKVAKETEDDTYLEAFDFIESLGQTPIHFGFKD